MTFKKNLNIHLKYLTLRRKYFTHSEIRRKASLANKKVALQILSHYPVSYYRFFSPSLKNNHQIIKTMLLKDAICFRYLPNIKKNNPKYIEIAYFFINKLLENYTKKSIKKQKRLLINSNIVEIKKATDIIKLKRNLKIIQG